MTLAINHSAITFSHIGQRKENQDRHCILSSPDQQSLLIIVADGMGGHKGGALAAQAIIDTAEGLWKEYDATQSAEDFLGTLVAQSHTAVLEKGQQQSLSPRSTLAALYIFKDGAKIRAVSIHAGDSRIIQFSNNQHIAQTIDHSLAQLQVFRGKISQTEVATHPDQNKVISNIGGEDQPDPEITHWDLKLGNRFVVCSDGFWEIFDSTEILALYDQNKGSNEAISTSFFKKLEHHPKQDNTTVIMLELSQSEQDSTMAETTNEPEATEPPDIELDKLETKPEPETETQIPQSANGFGWKLPAVLLLLVALYGFFFYSGSSSEPFSDSAIDVAGNSADNTDPGSTNETNEDNAPPASTGEFNENADNTSTEPAASPENEIINEATQRNDRVLGSVDINTEIEISSDEEIPAKVEDALRVNGHLGTADTLEVSQEDSLAGNRIIRMQQMHQGIPVFGAEIVAIESDGNIIHISGSTGSDIEINIVPSLSYVETIIKANQSLGKTLVTKDEGQLLIFDAQDSYHLAWFGLVSIDGSKEQIILDAHDGSVLSRLPSIIGAE